VVAPEDSFYAQAIWWFAISFLLGAIGAGACVTRPNPPRRLGYEPEPYTVTMTTSEGSTVIDESQSQDAGDELE
jgi:hypothetical protein